MLKLKITVLLILNFVSFKLKSLEMPYIAPDEDFRLYDLNTDLNNSLNIGYINNIYNPIEEQILDEQILDEQILDKKILEEKISEQALENLDDYNNRELNPETESVQKFNSQKNKNHKCDICLKKFKRSRDVEVHMRSHTGQKPFYCNVPDCKESFSTKNGLVQHMTKHTQNRPFKCEQCNKTFKCNRNLKDHGKVHDSNRIIFSCDREDCSATFRSKSSFNAHMKRHLGLTKMFSCNICGKGFERDITLRQHIRTHTGERPYKCTFLGCDKTFVAHSNKIDHEKLHLDYRPYECNICHNRFKLKGHLKQHKTTHNKQKAYTCDLCFNGYSRKWNLITHLEQQHNLDHIEALNLLK